MRMMGDAFIVGESIESALARGRRDRDLSLCSFDVLGEGARSDSDAQRYFAAYERAIEALRSQQADSVHRRSGISVKLSALEPRYSLTQHSTGHGASGPANARSGAPRLRRRDRPDHRCRGGGSARSVARHHRGPRATMPARAGWGGLGLAVQAYGRRAPLVLDWVARACKTHGSAHVREAGQGRLLGCGDQARPGARARQLPSLYLEDCNRCQLSRLRAAAVWRGRRHLPAVRHTQRTDGRCGDGACAAGRGLRVPASARHGPGALRRGARGCARLTAGARIRAGRHARGAAALPRAPAARERRQHLLRAPFPQQRHPRGAGRGPNHGQPHPQLRRHRRARARRRSGANPRAARPLPLADQLPRRGLRQPGGARGAPGRARARPGARPT